MRKPFLITRIFACLLITQTVYSAENALAPAADHFLSLRSQAAADAIRQLNSPSNRNASAIGEPVTAVQALHALDQASIQKALVISSAYLFSAPELNSSGEQPLIKQENDFLATQVDANPDRLRGLCSVNPLSSFALDEAQRCAQKLKLNGLYLNFHSSNVNLRSSEHIGQLKALFQFLEVLQFPVLIQVRTRSASYGSVDVKLLIDNVLSEAPSLDIHIAKFAGHGNYDYAADRAMGEFIEAFEDGRLEPSRVQFDLADTVSVIYSNTSPEEAAVANERNSLLSDRIKQLDIQQVLFASNWPAMLKPSFTSLDEISLRLSNMQRHLVLDREEWDSLLQAESRLFD